MDVLRISLLVLFGLLNTCVCHHNKSTINTINVDFYTVEKGLIETFKENYDPTIRPWLGPNKWVTSKFVVEVEFWLHSLLEIDEKEETMTTSMAILIYWWDNKLAWNPALYKNITFIYMQAKHVWCPLWFITNSVDRDSVSRFEDWMPVLYNFDGQAMWQRMGTIKTSCAIDTTYFPFDKQVCSVNLHWYEYQIIARHLNINGSERTRFYKDNGLWELISYNIVTNDLDLPAYKIVYTFKRKPDYIIYNVLFPVLLIAVLGPLVFLLPVECGERVSYSITVLLTVSVYMTIISDYLPNSSRPMAYMIYGLFSLEIFCALIVVVVVFTTKVYHLNTSIPVPRPLIALMSLLKCCAVRKRLYSIMQECGRRLLRIDTTPIEQKYDTELNVYLDRINTFLDGEQYYIYDANDKEIESESDNGQELLSWSDIAVALDRIALYTFYIIMTVIFVVSICVVFVND